MILDHERIQQIPEPYKTFLQALWPVIRTHEDGSLIQVNGIPFWMIHRAVADRYGYSEQQVQQLSEQLRSRGWIEVDSLGFYRPVGLGVAMLRTLNQPEVVTTVPDLPEF